MKKSVNFLKTALIGAALAVVAIVSCNRPDRRVAEWREFYKDSAFIEIPGETLGDIFDNTSHYSPMALGNANLRLMKTRYIDGDTLCMGVSSGADARVSEIVYRYMMWVTKKDNEKLKTRTDHEIRLHIPDSTYAVMPKDRSEEDGFMKISGPVPGVGEASKR